MLLKICRKKELMGNVTISGAKNSALAIICASVVADGEVVLDNVPHITDVNTLFSILTNIGYEIKFVNNTATIKLVKRLKTTIRDEHVRKMRGSYYFIGAMLARTKKVNIANSGGCDLGYRPINYHLDGFKKMGAKITEKKGFMKIKAKTLLPTTIDLEFPSVGATINLMLAAVKTEGTTIINNCAKEPEIEDVANFLNCLGANITGAGSKTITINGVKNLHGCHYKIMPDRIEAGTYLILGALLNGAILSNINSLYLTSLINLLRQSGYIVETTKNKIKVSRRGNPKNFNITIGPYPAFPTDLGQPLSVLATQIEGTSIIKETIFKKRYSHVEELNKMGANIKVIDDNITIEGKTPLHNANLTAHDLRGAAALVLASSLSKDYSTIDNIDVFLRGYENPLAKLASFGIEAYFTDHKDGEK